MNANNIVKQWMLTKLIIGNGFDLYCGLKTSYKDFFEYNLSKKSEIKLWIDKFKKSIGSNKRIDHFMRYWVVLENYETINVWDILFTLLYEDGKITGDSNWSNIEIQMAKALKASSEGNDSTSLNFEDVYNFVKGNAIILNKNTYILACFTYVKGNCQKRDFELSNEKGYYDFLLSELKSFEKGFGEYIKKQHEENNDFKNNSKRALEKLCSINKLVSVDTFNYDTPENVKILPILHNINGNVDNPIFGIDSTLFQASDSRYIFTKISRRMNQEVFRIKRKPMYDFSNVIIFGCSLSQADFGYFFPILDKMKITDFGNDSKIAFAYSIYDQDKKEEIKSNLSKSVALLFEEYAKYKGYIEPGRLLDSLSTQGRVLFYKIKNLQ